MNDVVTARTIVFTACRSAELTRRPRAQRPSREAPISVSWKVSAMLTNREHAADE